MASVTFLVKTSWPGGGADEGHQLVPSLLVQPGRLLGDAVDAAVDVGVGRLVQTLHGFEDGKGFWAEARRVQIHQAMPVDLDVEDREVLLDGFDV